MTQRVSAWKRFVALFPEHQIYLRTNGKVRFLTLSTPVQLSMFALGLVLFTWISIATWTVITHSQVVANKNSAISDAQGDYEALLSDMGELQRQVLSDAQRLEIRQKLLKDLIKDETVDWSEIEFDKPAGMPAGIGKQSSYFTPDATPWAVESQVKVIFRGIEVEQLNLSRHLLAHIKGQRKAVDTALERAGFESVALLADRAGATGGPLVEDPIAKQLPENDILFDVMTEIAALNELRQVAGSIPSAQPLPEYYISSNFGRRRDPFTKRWAWHAGIDLAAWHGTAVLAANDGIVIHAGYKPAYGRMVEIDHGNGFKTRYGHMRKVSVKKGARVTQGVKVGEVGKTGRSTGPHLHYEVWHNGKPINPTSLLKATQHVLEIQGRNPNRDNDPS
ncbi:MAG: M23 family metallopeptidase [Pseudomonadota bacterium]